MENLVEVETGSYEVASSPNILITRGVGSCVVVCLYDSTSQTGALIHIMLPDSEGATVHPFRFANTAFPIIFELLEKMGVRRKNLHASLIGGASMFPEFDDLSPLGSRNIAAVEKILKQEEISITMRDVGGNRGRSVEFILNSGLVTVSKSM